MKLFNIPEGKFKLILKKGLSLDLLFVLQQVKEGVDVVSTYTDSKASALVSTLQRRGYITEIRLTEEGEALYDSLISEEEEVKVKKMESKESEWEEFLKYYPPNNRFIWKGRAFEGDRGIKNNTKAGKELYTKILNSGIKPEDLWKAVVAEAIAKMEQSFRTGENKMKYFQNTESYLRQQKYMNFIEEGKELTPEDVEAYKEAYNRNKKKVTPKRTIDI